MVGNSYLGDAYEPNLPLIAKIEEFERTGDLVIVWSGGGRAYAAEWARRFFGQGERGNPTVFTSSAKDIMEMCRVLDSFIDRGLIIIDDDKGVLDWFNANVPKGKEDKVKTYFPAEFVEEKV
jgi:hypothetical protein